MGTFGQQGDKNLFCSISDLDYDYANELLEQSSTGYYEFYCAGFESLDFEVEKGSMSCISCFVVAGGHSKLNRC